MSGGNWGFGVGGMGAEAGNGSAQPAATHATGSGQRRNFRLKS